MHWLQDPHQRNADSVSNVRWEASRHFRKKKKKYLKSKISELDTNSKNKNIKDFCRGISDFKKGYQPRTRGKRGIWLQTPSVVWLGGGIISL